MLQAAAREQQAAPPSPPPPAPAPALVLARVPSITEVPRTSLTALASFVAGCMLRWIWFNSMSTTDLPPGLVQASENAHRHSHRPSMLGDAAGAVQ